MKTFNPPRTECECGGPLEVEHAGYKICRVCKAMHERLKHLRPLDRVAFGKTAGVRSSAGSYVIYDQTPSPLNQPYPVHVSPRAARYLPFNMEPL